MRIAQVAPPLESVPPARYGGTERVIATLTEQLSLHGHDVTLFASGDSHTSARLVPTVECALWHQAAYQDFGPFWVLALGELWARLEDFDIVHSHLDYVGFPLARASARPVVTTLHGRLDLPELQPLYRAFTDVPLVSISQAQRQPVRQANWVATVQHGIDLDQYTFGAGRGDYLAFVGRISPDKGLDTAIRVARRAGVPLKVAARPPLSHPHDPVARVDRDYYDQVVRPLLEAPGVELVGEVGSREKDDLLRNAAALLFPIRWPEPFGLVMVEALACGTPVLALRCGSVPEVLVDGTTGLICDSEEELVQAVGRIEELDRARCRAEAEHRFSAAAMAAAYERVYEQLTRPERLVLLGARTQRDELARMADLTIGSPVRAVGSR
jgi:glycosyltransferase involved in cell wall biosynthesis